MSEEGTGFTTESEIAKNEEKRLERAISAPQAVRIKKLEEDKNEWKKSLEAKLIVHGPDGSSTNDNGAQSAPHESTNHDSAQTRQEAGSEHLSSQPQEQQPQATTLSATVDAAREPEPVEPRHAIVETPSRPPSVTGHTTTTTHEDQRQPHVPTEGQQQQEEPPKEAANSVANPNSTIALVWSDEDQRLNLVEIKNPVEATQQQPVEPRAKKSKSKSKSSSSSSSSHEKRNAGKSSASSSSSEHEGAKASESKAEQPEKSVDEKAVVAETSPDNNDAHASVPVVPHVHIPKWRDEIRIHVSSSGSESHEEGEQERERRKAWLDGIEGQAKDHHHHHDEKLSKKLKKAGSNIVQQLSPRSREVRREEAPKSPSKEKLHEATPERVRGIVHEPVVWYDPNNNPTPTGLKPVAENEQKKKPAKSGGSGAQSSSSSSSEEGESKRHKKGEHATEAAPISTVTQPTTTTTATDNSTTAQPVTHVQPPFTHPVDSPRGPEHAPTVWYREKPDELNHMPKWRSEIQIHISSSSSSGEDGEKKPKEKGVKKLIRTLSHRDGNTTATHHSPRSRESEHSPRTPRVTTTQPTNGAPMVTTLDLRPQQHSPRNEKTTPRGSEKLTPRSERLIPRNDKLGVGEKSPRGQSLRDLKSKLSPRGKEERVREREAAATVVSFPVGRPETTNIIEDLHDPLKDAYRPIETATTNDNGNQLRVTTTTTTTTATSTTTSPQEGEKREKRSSKSQAGGSTASHSSHDANRQKEKNPEQPTATTATTTAPPTQASNLADLISSLPPSSRAEQGVAADHAPTVWYAEKPDELNHVPKWRNEIQIHISSTESSSSSDDEKKEKVDVIEKLKRTLSGKLLHEDPTGHGHKSASPHKERGKKEKSHRPGKEEKDKASHQHRGEKESKDRPHVPKETSPMGAKEQVTFPVGRPEATKILTESEKVEVNVFGTRILVNADELREMTAAGETTGPVASGNTTATAQQHQPQSVAVSSESVERSESGALRFHDERTSKEVQSAGTTPTPTQATATATATTTAIATTTTTSTATSTASAVPQSDVDISISSESLFLSGDDKHKKKYKRSQKKKKQAEKEEREKAEKERVEKERPAEKTSPRVNSEKEKAPEKQQPASHEPHDSVKTRFSVKTLLSPRHKDANKISPRKKDGKHKEEEAASLISFPIGRPEQTQIIEARDNPANDAYRPPEPTTPKAEATNNTNAVEVEQKQPASPHRSGDKKRKHHHKKKHHRKPKATGANAATEENNKQEDEVKEGEKEVKERKSSQSSSEEKQSEKSTDRSGEKKSAKEASKDSSSSSSSDSDENGEKKSTEPHVPVVVAVTPEMTESDAKPTDTKEASSDSKSHEASVDEKSPAFDPTVAASGEATNTHTANIDNGDEDGESENLKFWREKRAKFAEIEREKELEQQKQLEAAKQQQQQQQQQQGDATQPTQQQPTATLVQLNFKSGSNASLATTTATATGEQQLASQPGSPEKHERPEAKGKRPERVPTMVEFHPDSSSSSHSSVEFLHLGRVQDATLPFNFLPLEATDGATHVSRPRDADTVSLAFRNQSNQSTPTPQQRDTKRRKSEIFGHSSSTSTGESSSDESSSKEGEDPEKKEQRETRRLAKKERREKREAEKKEKSESATTTHVRPESNENVDSTRPTASVDSSRADEHHHVSTSVPTTTTTTTTTTHESTGGEKGKEKR